MPLKRYDFYWYNDEAVQGCLSEDVAELEESLNKLYTQKPAWYVVESKNEEANMIFRSYEVAEMYAVGLADEGNGEVTITRLYTHPKPITKPEGLE